MADEAAHAVIDDRSASPEEVNDVIALFQNAVQQDPDGLRTLPPEPISIAQSLVERRGGPFDNVPTLVLAGFAATDRELGADAANDVTGFTPAQVRQMSYMEGYLSLAEADLHLGLLSSGKDAILQAETKVNVLRPSENSSPGDKMRFAELAAQYWFMRGLYADEDGRKMDALVDYRNALALYPPRRPRPDRRDEVMASAGRLWKDLGGTAQGWNDWATQSSLAGFYAGSGGSEAWSKLAKSSPELILTDALSDRWNPQDLAKRTKAPTASLPPPSLRLLPGGANQFPGGSCTR